jgi:hypothetical protein
MFEVKQALVRKKTSTGRLWNEYGDNLPVDKVDKYPKREYGAAFPLSKATGSLFVDKKASNPEMITNFGYLPKYPEEDRIMSMLEREAVPRADKAEAREFFGGIKMEEVRTLPAEFGVGVESQQIISRKFNEANIEKLKGLGFSDALIAEAIKKEAERDLAMVLEKPDMFKETQIASAIQTAYENYILSKTAKTGENATGLVANSLVQNPGVRAYAGAAQEAEMFKPVVGKTGLARLVRELGEEERKEYLNPAAANVSNAALSGGGASIGTGPSGRSTSMDPISYRQRPKSVLQVPGPARESFMQELMRKAGTSTAQAAADRLHPADKAEIEATFAPRRGRPVGSIESEETRERRKEKTEATRTKNILERLVKKE